MVPVWSGFGAEARRPPRAAAGRLPQGPLSGASLVAGRPEVARSRGLKSEPRDGCRPRPGPVATERPVGCDPQKEGRTSRRKRPGGLAYSGSCCSARKENRVAGRIHRARLDKCTLFGLQPHCCSAAQKVTVTSIPAPSGWPWRRRRPRHGRARRYPGRVPPPQPCGSCRHRLTRAWDRHSDAGGRG
jgi:hypothetical protein